MRATLAFIVTLLVCGWVVYPDEPRINIEASLDRSEVLIGDPIQYVVTLKYPEGVVAEWPSVGASLEGFSVEASGVESPRRVEGIITEARWYRLMSFSAGTHTIPETVVTYRTSDGASHEVRTQAVTITVKGLLPTDWEHQDIRQAKPLIPMRLAWWWLLGGVAVIGGLIGAWLRRQRQRSEVSSAPPRPAHEIALEALSKLSQEDLPSGSRYEEYYVRLSGIVRSYIEARFGLKAPEMTTEEFLQVASGAQVLSQDQRRLLQEFLEHSDLVKFARYKPSRHEADETFEAARRFIQDTVPMPVTAIDSAQSNRESKIEIRF